MAQGVPLGRVDEQIVRRLWWAALDTLQDEILLPMNLTKGLWLASPLPALYEPRLLDHLQGWVWAPDELSNLNYLNPFLLPPSSARSINQKSNSQKNNFNRFPLLKDDGHDPLLIIITPEVQVAIALQGNPGERNLLMRSDPETFKDLLTMLDIRLDSEESHQANQLREALANLGQLRSNEDLSKIFWPLLASRMAGIAPSLNIQTLPDSENLDQLETKTSEEILLLEALTHEVRTPLATIRTLIRSLLRRKDLSQVVISRLKQIDTECTEQIDRFGLIFNAVELERNETKKSNLASTDLGNMLQMLYPAWKEKLYRRGLALNLDIASDLPQVLSDPERLELMLGGLIDRNTRGLPPGGRISLVLRPAGQRLKLQIIDESPPEKYKKHHGIEQNSDLGTVLSWNPNTGSLQLTQGATQRLLASLGGRLTSRRDRGLIVFFPIAEAK
ncbi:Signal transduction histidine kinase [Prochlorococcus sp. MIT 0601]|nr:Signal transduction histidine kinase [Prochlorococcus sp. MIT 0601]